MAFSDFGISPTAGPWVNGTAVDTAVKLSADNAAAFSATAPGIILTNNDIGSSFFPGAPGQTGVKEVVLENLWLKIANAGVGLTVLELALVIDGIARYSSGGADVTASAVNTFMHDTSATITKVYAGQITALGASAAARFIAPMVLRAAIPVVNDQYQIFFGDEGPFSDAMGGTGIVSHSHRLPRIKLLPGHSALIYLWGAGMTTAPTFEWRLTWFEG